MASAPSARRGFSPLDRELGLLPGHLTPRLQEQLTRLGAWMPFERAAQLLTWLTGAPVTEPTARRLTLRAGAAYVACQDGEAERIAREFPPPPPGPVKQVMEVDGAMVPLVGGEWTEVKTLVLGAIGEPVREDGEWVVHSQELSYFSRCAPAERFAPQALVEVHRRGVERAETVAAVTDGAEWEQGFIDLHRADAIRILDFPHAAQRLPLIAQAVWGADTPEVRDWVAARTRQLKEEGPAPLLAELAALAQSDPEAEGWAEHRAYLQKRQAHMQYPAYRTWGLPLGSGAVESGNKLVVEARLKGAGMHWALSHVDPMLALRNVVCNDRWEEAWPQIVRQWEQEADAARVAKSERRRAPAATPRPGDRSGEREPIVPAPPRPRAEPPRAPAPAAAGAAAQRRPAADHPWRRYGIGRARYQPRPSLHGARS